MAASEARAAAPIDTAALRASAEASVCRVTVKNAWGIPVATCSGFLIGDGRFVVTDLGTVARPMVEKVDLAFADGSTAVASQFAMADATLGLVALRIDSPTAKTGDAAPARKGLPLASALPPLDGTASVAAAGWNWGVKLEVFSGKLVKGPAIREVAALARVDTPAGIDTFVRLSGDHLASTGAPVFAPDGTVVAVTMEVTVNNVSAALAMPASTLRSALLGATPQLKPLSELPKPLWPSRLLRFTGAAATAADMPAAFAKYNAATTCPQCNGRGEAPIGSLPSTGTGAGYGSAYGYGYGYATYGPCPRCHKEKVAASEVVMKALSPAVEGATRTFWAPVIDERSRQTARKAGTALLTSFASGGPYFQHDFAVAEDGHLDRASLPQGVLLYAEVQKKADGPDGRYVILTLRSSKTTVAVKLDDLLAPGAKSMTGRKEPADNSWLLLAGVAVSEFKGGGPPGRVSDVAGIFVLPREWPPAPVPVDPPPVAGPASRQ